MLPEETDSPKSPSPIPAPTGRRSWRRLVLRLVLGLLLGLVVVVLAGGWWVRSQLHGSLPKLDGEVALTGLSQPVSVERDALGVPTIRGENRVDVARALGYVHAQERYFQLDLIRRQAAGELSELVGGGALEIDKRLRTHRFRWRAQNILATMPASQKQLLEVYAEGVNAGLGDLASPPLEYLVMQAKPQPWLAEDSLLVVFAMYLDLQGRGGRREASFGILQAVQPELYEFLTPKGDRWDGPIVGEAWTPPPMPSAERFDLRRAVNVDGETGVAGEAEGNDETVGDEAAEDVTTEAISASLDDPWTYDPFDAAMETLPGSNNWAVAGTHSKHGGALLANDMHLRHSVPNIWFRVVLVYPDATTGEERRMTGVSLPGTPAVVAGSNGHVAWGFTNSYGDWSDLVVLETVDGEDLTYATPDGPRTLEIIEETIQVKGAEPATLEIRQSIWGPVVNRDAQGRRLAQRWTAHLPEAINLGLVDMEGAKDIESAIEIAHRCGVPAQNFVVADHQGRIGWTIIGPFPRRFGHDGVLPSSWADGTRGWDGLLTSEEVPTVLDPPQGRIWTANSRVVDGEMYELVRDGGYDRGARAQQIRDGLLALDSASEADMLAIQLDDRALFLERWHQLLRQVLATSGEAAHAELLAALDDWTGHASPDSVAYRMVRAFRDTLRSQAFTVLTAPSAEANERFDYTHLGGGEAPLWQMVTERPLHLLDPRFETWDEQFLAAVDAVLKEALEPAEGETTADTSLSEMTWGHQNRVWIRHPISRFFPPAIASRLDMPPVEIPGDRDMPRVQAPGFGASERLVVSPGREEDGIFHMPTGQSGHPLSPYYAEGFHAWANGEQTPFLPGATQYQLKLIPSAN